MCGRYTLTSLAAALAGHFDVAGFPELAPRYNVAPSQTVPVIRLDSGGRREAATARWGLVPSWAREPSSLFINARAETVAQKPSFRSAFRQRRCLVPADGFFEWARAAGRKQPWLFRPQDGLPWGFAGLWESWRGPGGQALQTCAVLTVAANDLVRPAHDRMPAVLRPEDYAAWLDPAARPDDLLRLLVPLAPEKMRADVVAPWVNDPRHDDPRCLELAG